jgi:periplasmic protein TonB
MSARGLERVPARAFAGDDGVSWVMLECSVDEVVTRPPAPLTLKLPTIRRRFGGLTASVLLHVLLLGLLVLHGEGVWSRSAVPGTPAPGAPGSMAGGGGGPRVAYITLPSAPPAEASAPRKVTPPISPPKRVVTPAAQPLQPEAVSQPADTARAAAPTQPALAAATGPGIGGGPGTTGNGGPGQGNGVGRGGSGNGPGGGGGKARPPEPRDMAFPFDSPPKELRGMSLSVTFWVRVDGVVERYTVEPEIKDRDYAKKFDEVMRAFRFTPAQAPDGTRIPGTTRISFTLPGKSSS